MDIVIIVLIITITLCLLLVILYFFRVWPFNKNYVAPDPRSWKINPDWLKRDFDYSPYGTDQPVDEIIAAYSYFIHSYCDNNPADTILCAPGRIPNW